MAFNYDSAEGLFTRLGRIYDEYQRTVAAYGTALNAGVDDIYEEYASGDDAIAIDGLFSMRDSYRNVHGSYLNGLVGVSNKTTIEQVNREVPLSNKSLSSALTELIRLM